MPWRQQSSLLDDLFSRQVFIRLALAAAVLFAGIRIASLVLTGKPISQVTGRTMHTVWEGLTDLLYLFCVLAWEAGSNAEAGYQEGKDKGTRGSLDRGREKGYRRDRAKRDRKRRRKEGSGREGRDGESSSITSGEGIGDAGTGRTVIGEENDREGRCPGRTIRERKIRGRKIKARQVRESSIKGRYPRGRRPEGPLLIVGAVQAITTLCTGSKQALTGFALYCLLAFLVAGRISMRQVSFLLVLSPLLLCLVTGVSEHTSGRLSGYPTRFVMQYHAFRYDLSDLAITIAERETEDPERGLEEGWKVVREALEMAVPSVLSGGYGKESGKPTELDAYRNQLSGIGLYPDADDYNDTLSVREQSRGLRKRQIRQEDENPHGEQQKHILREEKLRRTVRAGENKSMRRWRKPPRAAHRFAGYPGAGNQVQTSGQKRKQIRRQKQIDMKMQMAGESGKTAQCN